jgi:FAD/FMN-containing dehydrogenase/Fe-S oxidoreductase
VGVKESSALAAELRARIRGEVRFGAGDRALYSTDASNYRQVPIGVVIPRDVDDVLQTIARCRQYGAPVLPRGGGTSLAGQTCNVAVVIDFSKYMNGVIAIDAEKRMARVQPGLVLDELRLAAEEHTLTFGPDPVTHNRCTLGGMIGNNSCGVHSVMAGKTDANVQELDIVTYDGLRMRVGKTSDEEIEGIILNGGRRGEIYSRLKALRDRYADLIRARYPDIPRRVSGYNLEQLLPENGFHVARALVGTEGTCVTVLEATVRLVHSPPARSLVVLGYPDIYRACDDIVELMAHRPIGLEGFDDRLVADMKKKHLHPQDLALLPEGGGWMLVEFGGPNKREADDRARGLIDELKSKVNPPTMKLFDAPKEQEQIWTVRESGLGAAAFIPGEPPYWPGWEDSAAPPETFGLYLRELRHLMDEYGYEGVFYGHFGQGCLHTRINFDLTTAPGIGRFRAFMNDAADLVVRYGGSLSGEHGDGQARAELLPKMYGNELVEAFREFKTIWDPQGKMNPGKVVEPYRLDDNLRLGAAYNPATVQAHFKFPDDNGRFADATLRCVGVGKCRRLSGSTMCPTFMVTREEKHSTRGRARLLFEMMQGEVVRQSGWRDENVKEALDLCLACKGCKGECPVNVDMATYKAEFMSHYYAGRPRPVTAYTIGLIYWWARLAALMPGWANLLTQTPLLSGLLKKLGGIAPERRIPAFATETFRQWFRHREPRTLKQWVGPRARNGAPRPQVILWADTFNNHFLPETLQAAVEVLEAAGYHVIVPRQSLCCGRPLYDYGFLDQAKHLLRQALTALRPYIEAGIPVVGLEPSCIAVFRDEMINLFPDDENAKRLSAQSFLLSEFLDRQDYQPPPVARKVLVHGHCHHKAIMRMEDEAALFTKMGLDYRILDSGCCGMAGAFGFERGEHYDVSIRVGERVLLPSVRSAAKDTLIIANGFSCREQIAQTTDRRALHSAQVLQMALRGDSGAREYPELRYIAAPARLRLTRKTAVMAAVLITGALMWRSRIARK